MRRVVAGVRDPRPRRGHFHGRRLRAGEAARILAALMEPVPVELSTSLVLIRPQSRSRSAATILLVALQLLFVGLTPVADARAWAADTGTAAGVHIEKPGVHHPVHNPADCVFCTALQLGAAPAPAASVPEAGAPLREPTDDVQPPAPSALPFTSQVARAPPAA